jgi:hypothetical protein
MLTLVILLSTALVIAIVFVVSVMIRDERHKACPAPYVVSFGRWIKGQRPPKVKPGEYLLYAQDQDLGTLMGGKPDPAPRAFARFSEALEKGLELGSDEHLAGIVDSNGELLCLVGGEEVRWVRPVDRKALEGGERRDVARDRV